MNRPSRDGWIDRQLPQGDEIFLDHVGFFVADLEAAGRQLERLGCQVSPRNVQYNANEQGDLVPTGTSNRLALLSRGFIEVLAATSETPLADQLRRARARYEGLRLIALTHTDMAAQRRRLMTAGFAMQSIVDLRRRVATSQRERQMAYSVLRTEPRQMTEGPGADAHQPYSRAVVDSGLDSVRKPGRRVDRALDLRWRSGRGGSALRPLFRPLS